jgi:ATP-dependent protease ClpP protease subunit
MNFNPVNRPANRPQAALDWFKKSGIAPSAVNKLEVRAEGDTCEIQVIGSIGKSWWDDSGVSEKEFRAALDQCPAGKPICIKINSEGGSVQDGLGIYNAINDRWADITCVIQGYALSIASVFPLAASKVVSPKSAIWMIHCAWSMAQGNAADFRKSADMLDAHDETLMDIYASATGKSRNELRAAMQNETWIKGADAVAWGLADETDPEEPAVAASATTAPGAMPVAATNVFAVNQSPATPPANLTQPQPPKKMNEPTTPAAALTAANNKDVLAEVQAELARERRARITAEVTRRAENKIKNDQIDMVIDIAMSKGEKAAYDFIDSLPAARVAAEPLGHGVIDMGNSPVLAGWGAKPTNTVENIFKTHSTPAARYAALKDNYSQVMAEARSKDTAAGINPNVMAANSYSATVTTNFLVMGPTIQIGPKFAPIRAFTRDVSVDPYKPLATGVMKFTTSVQDGSDVQTNATNFTTGDSTVTAVSVAVNQYTASANLTNKDLNSGIRMEDIAMPKLRSLGSKVVQAAVAPITAANFGTLAGITSAPTSFGFGELQQLWGQLKKANSKNLILDGEYLAGLINVPTFFQTALSGGDNTWTNAFGWDLIALNTEFSTADANVRGFACDPQAIGVIAGLPLIDNAGIPGGILSVSTGVIPGANLPIAAYLWFDVNARTYYMSYDIMFGAAKLDGTAGAIIKSA